MKSKLIPIAYTVGLIKPNIALKDDKVAEIMDTIDKNDFEVFHQKKKTLTNEEILNLYYNYRNSDWYPELKEHLRRY
jgi:nucleoside diphosphate kinase